MDVKETAITKRCDTRVARVATGTARDGPSFSRENLIDFPLENDILAKTSAQIMELNQNLAYIKDSSSLTF